MKILALELSSGQGSIAFLEGETTRFAAEFANDRKHSGIFFESLQRCFLEAGKPMRIVVGLGPGSYAGARIAIAAAIGLQAVTGAELSGLPSFLALPTDELAYVTIGNARRQSFWFAQVQARRCIDGPTLCTEDELAARISAADSPTFSSDLSRARRLHPAARILAQLAQTHAELLVRPPLEPIYLREPHITRPKAA